MKYKKQYRQMLEKRLVVAQISLYERDVCINFQSASKKMAERIAAELVSQMICESYMIQDEHTLSLWLQEVDILYLQAAGTDLEILIKDICEELGFEMALTFIPPPS